MGCCNSSEKEKRGVSEERQNDHKHNDADSETDVEAVSEIDSDEASALSEKKDNQSSVAFLQLRSQSSINVAETLNKEISEATVNHSRSINQGQSLNHALHVLRFDSTTSSSNDVILDHPRSFILDPENRKHGLHPLGDNNGYALAAQWSQGDEGTVYIFPRHSTEAMYLRFRLEPHFHRIIVEHDEFCLWRFESASCIGSCSTPAIIEADPNCAYFESEVSAVNGCAYFFARRSQVQIKEGSNQTPVSLGDDAPLEGLSGVALFNSTKNVVGIFVGFVKNDPATLIFLNINAVYSSSSARRWSLRLENVVLCASSVSGVVQEFITSRNFKVEVEWNAALENVVTRCVNLFGIDHEKKRGVAANQDGVKRGNEAIKLASLVLWIWFYKQESLYCCYCGRDIAPMSRPSTDPDHAISFDRISQGDHRAKNILLCCLTCNTSKQDRFQRDPAGFAAEKKKQLESKRNRTAKEEEQLQRIQVLERSNVRLKGIGVRYGRVYKRIVTLLKKRLNERLKNNV